MTHKIPVAKLNEPLQIPHLLQWPHYSEPNTYSAIIPEAMEMSSQDFFSKGYGVDLKISNILERRPAKGDWSKQDIHKSPHYVRFIAK